MTKPSLYFISRTDFLIQQTIREKFKHCTVLTVAHRLHTVMDSDRIIVMNAGNAVEFDIPHVLLQNAQSVLNQMVEATGGEAEKLRTVANESYTRMKLPPHKRGKNANQLLDLLDRSTLMIKEKNSSTDILT